METQRVGSTRLMVPVEPGVINLIYSDGWSAFDRGRSSQPIPGIGKARCACAVKSFELARSAGIETHFMDQVDEVTIRVKEFSVPGRKPLSGKVHGRVLPLEWIWRVRAAGSLLERLRKGALTPKDLGYAPGTVVTEGLKLPKIRLECTTKFESVDRHLSAYEARKIAEIDERRWNEVWNLISQAIEVTDAQYEKAGFLRPDGKLEIALFIDGRVAIVDVFGTPDEDRIIDRATGNVFSKDLIRNHLKALPWKSELDRAKTEYPADMSKWPPYPLLPDELVERVSSRYAEVALRYSNA